MDARSELGRLDHFADEQSRVGVQIDRHQLAQDRSGARKNQFAWSCRYIDSEVNAEFMGGIGVLLFLLGFHLLCEVAFPIAVHHRLVFVDAKILDDVCLVEFVAALNHRVYHAVQHEYCTKGDMEQGFNHGANVTLK